MPVGVRRAEAPIVEETAADEPMPTPAEYPLNGNRGSANEKPEHGRELESRAGDPGDSANPPQHVQLLRRQLRRA